MNNPPPEWDGPNEDRFLSGVVKLATGLLAVGIAEGANETSTVYLKMVDGVTRRKSLVWPGTIKSLLVYQSGGSLRPSNADKYRLSLKKCQIF